MARPTVRAIIKFLILVIICGILGQCIVKFHQVVMNDFPLHFLGVDKGKVKVLMDTSNEISENSTPFILNTPGCHIPRTPIFPEYYKLRWHLKKIPDCDYETELSTLSEDGILTLNPESTNSKCCLHEISRLNNRDKDFKMTMCEDLNTFANVSEKEILLTRCGDSLNFHANIPITPDTQLKLDYWRNVPNDELPPNVIIFGVDTMSRSHAYRSLPKTLRLMKKMGFKDFKGFHSVHPRTLHNFFPLLTGLEYDEGRSLCAPNWRTPFDDCPFIWKNFSRRNYITMYIEDGSQSFNFGGQSGFINKPTDYYIHALFNSIRELRMKESKVLRWIYENQLDCTSGQTVPQFVVRYSKRFIRKFRKTPFFSFTWLTDPYHQSQYTLGVMDEEIRSFFRLLHTFPNMLKRTIVIFLGDHGDVRSHFQTMSSEGIIERGLPPLMIRFPKTLLKMFPKFEKAAQRNTEALVTTFDLHHTLKHILHLSSKKTDKGILPKVKFQPSMADRSSLFKRVDLKRTCTMVRITPESCLCEALLGTNPIKNPSLLKDIMKFVVLKLNQFVSVSKYHKVCHEWTASVSTILSSRVVKRFNNYTSTLVQFKASPGDAEFEVKVKVPIITSVVKELRGQLTSVNTDIREYKLIGEFSRLNSYQNQSSCVGFQTDDDKKMKELCYCKSLVK